MFLIIVFSEKKSKTRTPSYLKLCGTSQPGNCSTEDCFCVKIMLTHCGFLGVGLAYLSYIKICG